MRGLGPLRPQRHGWRPRRSRGLRWDIQALELHSARWVDGQHEVSSGKLGRSGDHDFVPHARVAKDLPRRGGGEDRAIPQHNAYRVRIGAPCIANTRTPQAVAGATTDDRLHKGGGGANAGHRRGHGRVSRSPRKVLGPQAKKWSIGAGARSHDLGHMGRSVTPQVGALGSRPGLGSNCAVGHWGLGLALPLGTPDPWVPAVRIARYEAGSTSSTTDAIPACSMRAPWSGVA
mmetsp:Transcript_31658/g.87406  ORF Transcript_31658/g.87406 Transcript_31658/m.87406 type:complete len:232 (-) Transcript_31658:192-887(-)